ncbi:MAG TPA: hypothetical protein VFO86_05720 [Terriglobia bacterium]|nr:hypothetical protein [Terriglobia bacterium]
MTIKVYYGTGGLSGFGKISGPAEFASIDAAKSAPIPPGVTFMYAPAETGNWVYRTRGNWEFYESEVS